RQRSRRLWVCNAEPAAVAQRRLATRSFRLLPALNAGYWLAGISIFSVVPGFTPVRDLRWRISKVPKPVRVTLEPLEISADMVSNRASTVSLTAFLESFVAVAT